MASRCPYRLSPAAFIRRSTSGAPACVAHGLADGDPIAAAASDRVQVRCAVEIGGQCDPKTGRWSYGNYEGRTLGRNTQAFNAASLVSWHGDTNEENIAVPKNRKRRAAEQPPRATVRGPLSPISDLSRCSKLGKLLDHLVGAGEQGRRNIDAQ